MPLPKLPTSGLDDVNQRRRRIETLNNVLDFSFDDSRVRTPAEIAAGVTPVNPAFPELDARRYGYKADWNGTTGTDNLGPLNTAYAVAVAKAANDYGAEIFIPEGKGMVSDEWDVWRINSPRLDITIKGVDQLNSILVANFYGAGKALIRCVDPAETDRASPTSIRDLGFENASTSGGICPVFIWILGHGESRVDRVRFGTSNNTHMRLVSAQNVRGTDVVSFFGGRHFNYKATSGITFSVDTTTNTITASGAIFSAGDVGKYFFVFPATAANRIRYLISAFTDSTHVTYTAANEITAAGADGHFEPARCSMTAGDATLTANASCFTSDMVGLVIYIRRARAGAFGDALLRATIASFTSATTVELDVTPDNNVTDEYFAVATLDMGLPAGWAGSSDVKFDKLHIEHYDGLAFVAQNNDSYHIDGKIHGETTPTDTAKSMAACWLDDYGGKFEVDLDSSCSMSDTRVYACNFNDMTLFDAVWSRHIINGTLFLSDEFTDPGGYLIIRGLNIYEDAADPYDYITDANFVADATDPRILLEGAVNMLGDSEKARIYAGRNAYFQPNGRFVYGATSEVAFEAIYSGDTGARIAFEDIGVKRWSIGNVAGGGQNLTITDESAAAVRFILGGGTGSFQPGADSTQNIGAAANRWANVFSAVLAVTDGVASPAAVAGNALIYVDSADGSLKVKFASGTVKTLATDP